MYLFHDIFETDPELVKCLHCTTTTVSTVCIQISICANQDLKIGIYCSAEAPLPPGWPRAELSWAAPRLILSSNILAGAIVTIIGTLLLTQPANKQLSKYLVTSTWPVSRADVRAVTTGLCEISQWLEKAPTRAFFLFSAFTLASFKTFIINTVSEFETGTLVCKDHNRYYWWFG